MEQLWYVGNPRAN